MHELHRLQTKVLYELSRHQTRRFSDMMAVTELTSDDFKFHLRKLIKLGLVTKSDDGVYELTAEGKELANRFDYENRSPIRQPKLTTVTFVRRENPENGATEYLFQQRLRQPFFHYWGAIGQPVKWGESFEDAAARGLKEQTGLVAPLTLKGFYRQRDLVEGSESILEDKLFVIFVADWQGDAVSNWSYAKNQWATVEWLAEQPQRFESCLDMLSMIETEKHWFQDNDSTYSAEAY